MEKQIINFHIDYHLDWKWDVSIEQIEKDIEAIKARGATHIDIDTYVEYDYCVLEIKAYEKRYETDDELAARLNNELFIDTLREEKERKLLKELKEKYEK